MTLRFPVRTVAVPLAVLGLLACQWALGQTPAPTPRVFKSLPPRSNPIDYIAHATAGKFTIAAEFDGHAVPAEKATYTTEDFVAVEVGVYGPADGKLALSLSNFSLSIDGKKPMTPQPYELIFKSLKDPDWVPPVTKGESKGGLNAGGGEGGANEPPPVVHMPPERQRAMELNVQNASLADGERPLPQAGLLYFRYGGKTNGLRSVDLIYAGPAGKVTIPLQ